MKVLICAPIAGHKQYSINEWFQWIANQTYKNYEVALCVNGDNQESLIEKLKQVQIKDIFGQVKHPIILRNKLKTSSNKPQNIVWAMESLRRYAVKHNYDKILRNDTDTIPVCRDTIQELINTDRKAVSALYFYKNTTVPIAVSRKRGTNPTLEDLREAVYHNELIELYVFGFGCALLDKSVFREIPFDYSYFGKEIGDDYGYCFALEQANIKRWLQPKLICKHLSESDKDYTRDFVIKKAD